MVVRTFSHYLIIIGLIAFASIVMAITVETAGSDESGIYPELPDKAGEWVGDQIRFCLNPKHQEVYNSSQLVDVNTCPEPGCGGQLGSMTLIEKSMLPSDTIVIKKRYTHPDGRQIIATIVMSGRERASIHRPEVCLVGNGSEIESSELMEVDFDQRAPMDIKVLNMLRNMRIGGVPRSFGSYFAYWFVGKDRETASHYGRLFWMAADRVVHNKSHRWSYIAVSGNRPLGDKDAKYKTEIEDFVSHLYPQMMIKRDA